MTEISSELRAVLRRVKLGPLMATLPERATLARQNRLSHLEFLELVLSDEVERRDRTSAERWGYPVPTDSFSKLPEPRLSPCVWPRSLPA